MRNADLSALTSFGIAHAHDEEAITGCTVIVAPQGATCGVDVRGGGPATRETDLLKPENMIELLHSVVLAGGSAFGLEASCGVMDVLAEREIGFKLGSACVPIVTGACLFDLLVGKAVHPDKEMGALGAKRALKAWENHANGKLAMGNVGAGCGATVGKLSLPQRAMKSGFGYCCLEEGGLITAALVAVNALGCVRDCNGNWIAGCLNDDRSSVMIPQEALVEGMRLRKASTQESGPCQNTTLGVVLTNAKLTKAQATKVSSCTHDAYARMIEPVHTSNDGDTIFTMASGEAGMHDTDFVTIMATAAMQRAIVNAVMHAKPFAEMKSASCLG